MKSPPQLEGGMWQAIKRFFVNLFPKVPDRPGRRAFLAGLFGVVAAPILPKLPEFVAQPVPMLAPGEFDPVLISLIRRNLPNLIAYDICGVQPMTGPTGLMKALETKSTENLKDFLTKWEPIIGTGPSVPAPEASRNPKADILAQIRARGKARQDS